MDTKLCVVCGTALPLRRRSDRRYCQGLCRVRAYLIRKGVGTRERRRNQGRSCTAAKVAGVTAGAIAIEVLRRELAQERRQRQSLEFTVIELKEKLVAGDRQRDAATQDARRVRDELETERQQLHHERKQHQAVERAYNELHDDWAQTRRRLRDCQEDLKLLQADWNTSNNNLKV